MARHSRDAVTVSAAVATRSCADCSSMEGHTSLSAARLVSNRLATSIVDTVITSSCLIGCERVHSRLRVYVFVLATYHLHIDVGRVNSAYPCMLRSHANSDHAPINNAIHCTTWTALPRLCGLVVIAQSLFEESMSVIFRRVLISDQ